MNDKGVADVIERLEYRCAVFSVVDANDVAVLLKAYTVQGQQLAAANVRIAALEANNKKLSALEEKISNAHYDYASEAVEVGASLLPYEDWLERFIWTDVDCLYQLDVANVRIAALEETNQALEMSVMDEDAIMTLGNISMDLERAEKRIAELIAERDELRLALRGRRAQLDAVPVDAIADCWRIVSEYHPMHPNTVGLWLRTVTP